MKTYQYRLDLEIANLGVSLFTKNEKLKNLLAQRYKDFISTKPPLMHLEYRLATNPISMPRKCTILYKDVGGGYFIKYKKKCCYYFRDCLTTLNFSTYRSIVLYSKSVLLNKRRLDKLLASPILSSFIYNFCGTSSKIMLHASGVVYKRNGYVFLGPSGEGKTSVAKASDGLLLGDESVAVSRLKNKYFISSVPWQPQKGLAFSSSSSKLKEIFILKKSKRNRLYLADRKSMLINFIDNSFYPFWSKARTNSMLDFCLKMYRNVPCYFLESTSAKAAWRNVLKIKRPLMKSITFGRR